MTVARSATRERLLSTAGDLFRRQGYHATGLSQIVKESGAPRGSLYHFFPGGKEELARAALEAGAAGFRTQLAETLESVLTLEGKIRTTFDLIGGELQSTNFEAGCPMASITLGPTSSLHSLCAGYLEQLRQLMEGILLEHDVPPAQATGFSTLIVSALEGAMVICRAGKSIEPLEQARDALASVFAEKGVRNTS